MCSKMILIEEDYFTPQEKISKFLFPNKKFFDISEIESDLFNQLNDSKKNYFVYLPKFEDSEISKIEFYFDIVVRVDGNLLKYQNKKKGTTKVYEIVRNNKEIVDFKQITEDALAEALEINLGMTSKPYTDAQYEEVVLYPSDEE